MINCIHTSLARWCGCYLIFFACHAGCQSFTYRATELPTELLAKPTVGGSAVELGRLEAAATPYPRIHRGDVLEVTVDSGDDTATPPARNQVVAEDGTISLPLIGSVTVEGLTLSAAAQAIRNAGIQAQMYVDPSVALAFKSRFQHRVTVVGAVNKPGQYELDADASNLTNALLAAGGLSERAGTIVEIQNPTFPGPSSRHLAFAPNGSVASPGRDGANTVLINLLDAMNDRPATFDLRNGAVVTVHAQEERFVTVIGLTTNQSMKMPYDRDFRVLEALARAGGTRYSPWIADKVRVIRRIPNSDETVTIALSLRKAKEDSTENLALAPGDIVSVEETPLTFTLGTIAQLLGVGQTAIVGAAALP